MPADVVTPEMIVASARAYVGTKWRHQGRLKDVEVDCAGLLTGVAAEHGLPHEDVRDYDRLPDGRMLAILRQHMDEIPVHELRVGDVPVIAYEKGPSHVGIVGDYKYGGLSIIHASNIRGAVVEHRLDAPTRSKIVAAFRIRQVVPCS